MVQDRLIEAYGFLRRMPDREGGWLRTKTMGLWDQVSLTAGMTAVEQAEYRLYRAGDPPRQPGLMRDEVARMEEALGWLAWISDDVRRIVHQAVAQLWRGNSRIDWAATGADPRISGSFERRKVAYRRGIAKIAQCLNGHRR